METIDYTRWAFYFVFGLPFLAWLLLGRSDALRVAAVVSVLVIVQSTLADRRYVWAIGVGPSVITAYVGFMGALIQSRRFPKLGWLGGAWAAFLVLAMSGVIIGTSSGGQLDWNVNTFQELFVESLLFFLLGAVALRTNESVRQFFLYFALLGAVVALIHFFTLATGYRFRGYRPTSGADWNYGGVFGNPNSMGSFYCMTIPVGLLLFLNGRLPTLTRALLALASVLMLGSLMLSTHRGGQLVTGLLMVYVLLRAGIRPVTLAFSVIGGALLLAAAAAVVSYVLPETVAQAEDLFALEGFRTERGEIWLRSVQVILSNPFGVGLAPENLKMALSRAGIQLATPHNLYLTIPLQVGIVGLVLFLAMVGTILGKIFRARHLSRLPIQRVNLDCALLCMSAFLIAGFAEPIWENGHKLNNLFWLLAGIGLFASNLVLAERRQPAREGAPALDAEHAPAHGI